MRNAIILALVLLGVVGAFFSAYLYAVPNKPLPPVFNPAPNPYARGIYASGMVESYQAQGANMNLYPEVPGTVTKVLVTEGQAVRQGDPLVMLDDSIQHATTDQLKSQAEAAHALLDELRAQPRRETLQVASAQVEMATASLQSALDTRDKQQHSFDLAPESVSRDVLDNAINAALVAKANLGVIARQLELTKAGAWVYDIKNQERQTEALTKAFAASTALLGKYTIKAPTDGVVMAVQAPIGSYASSLGTYDTYTQGYDPVVVMATGAGMLGARAYVDEILIARLPPRAKIKAQLFIQGTNTKIPLEFVRVQPYVSPKIQLSDQRLEKVDVRVLPVIFRFAPPPGVEVYPGQLVDIYIGQD